MEPSERNPANHPVAPIVALDLGEKRVGIAVCDELSISITRLKTIQRTSWKQLLQDVGAVIRRFDAKTLVIGFPLRANGSAGDAAEKIREAAEKFALSLSIPVYLQDEHLTSVAAEENLRSEGHPKNRISELVDAEAAAIILRDFIVSDNAKLQVGPAEQTI